MAAPTRLDPERLKQVIQAWFHLPFDEMGYRAERRHWGTYWNNGQVYTLGVPLADVPEFVADLQAYFADYDDPLLVRVDGRDVEARLGPVLVEAGCRPKSSEVFLSHDGTEPKLSSVDDLEILPVAAANLVPFVETRLRSWADLDEAPDPARVTRDVERRKQELSGTGRGLLAAINGDPAGVLWWHTDPLDWWINLLGTRLPYRKQGVAGRLLAECLHRAKTEGVQSVVINVQTDNEPALRLYHRLGFSNEVYWRRTYEIPAP